MKRYLLFMGAEHYPNGGWEDFAGDFDTIDEAKAAVRKDPEDWAHVVDGHTGRSMRLETDPLKVQ